jgi:hypothetical protein
MVTTKHHHIIKIQGLRKDKALMAQLATVLHPYVINAISYVTEPPTEVCSSSCHEQLKRSLKINAAIKALQQKYNKIIKDFDITKPEKVNVTYWKLELPEGQAPTDEAPNWEYVRNLVEGIMPH